MGRYDKLLTELTVTPMIAHAVELLRDAVPKRFVQAGVVAFSVGFTEFGRNRYPEIEWRESVQLHPRVRLQLTDAQESAAWMLVGLAAFYHARWEEVCGATDKVTTQFRALRDQFNREVRRKLNIEIEGYSYDRHLNGSVTVYL